MSQIQLDIDRFAVTCRLLTFNPFFFFETVKAARFLALYLMAVDRAAELSGNWAAPGSSRSRRRICDVRCSSILKEKEDWVS